MSLAHVLKNLPDRVEPARAARLMLWSIAGFSAVMIGWAGLARIPETAVAMGRIVPSRQLQVIGNLEGGVVEAILVRPGQKVAAGAVLLRLDPGAAAADFGRGTAAANALAARIARLEAEVAETAPRFAAGLAAAAPVAVATERALWSARVADLAAAMAGETARLDGARRALAQAEAEHGSHSEARAQAGREVAMIAPLVDKGIEPRISLDRAQSALAQARSAEAASGAAVARAAAAVAEARAMTRTAAGRLRTQSVDALAAAQAELAGQSAGLPALRTRVARTEIRSPIAGTVQRVLVATIGGAVAPGAPLVEVVPAGDALVVAARVRPADSAFVHVGQRAAVKLTAYDASVYGALEGRVTRISPDAVVDERSGDSHYDVRIVTAAKALRAPDGAMLPVAAGMVAQIDLIGRQRSVLSYVLNPVTKLRENAFRER